MIRPKDLVREFWCVDKDPYEDIVIPYKGADYIYRCDVDATDSYFWFFDDYEMNEKTWMFKFVIVDGTYENDE